jgi:bHLH factor
MTPHQMAQHPYQGSSQMNDPGPSSHPRGPPNLGQLSTRTPPLPNSSRTPASEGSISDAIDHKPADGHGSPNDSNQGSGGGGQARSGRSANMSNDEWARQRKDNHASRRPFVQMLVC